MRVGLDAAFIEDRFNAFDRELIYNVLYIDQPRRGQFLRGVISQRGGISTTDQTIPAGDAVHEGYWGTAHTTPGGTYRRTNRFNSHRRPLEQPGELQLELRRERATQFRAIYGPQYSVQPLCEQGPTPITEGCAPLSVPRLGNDTTWGYAHLLIFYDFACTVGGSSTRERGTCSITNADEQSLEDGRPLSKKEIGEFTAGQRGVLTRPRQTQYVRRGPRRVSLSSSDIRSLTQIGASIDVHTRTSRR